MNTVEESTSLKPRYQSHRTFGKADKDFQQVSAIQSRATREARPPRTENGNEKKRFGILPRTVVVLFDAHDERDFEITVVPYPDEAEKTTAKVMRSTWIVDAVARREVRESR